MSQKLPNVNIRDRLVEQIYFTIRTRKELAMKHEYSQEYMEIEDCPLDKWLEPHKTQLYSWIYRIYAQGYNDAVNELKKERDNDV